MNKLSTLKTKLELCLKKKILNLNLNKKPINLRNLLKNRFLKTKYKKWNNK